MNFKRTKWLVLLAGFILLMSVLEYAHLTGGLPKTVPIWLIVRVLGILAYLLLFFGLCLGIILAMPVWRHHSQMRRLFGCLHIYANTSGVVIACIHPLLSLGDPVNAFTWQQIFIPFTAPGQSFFYGLGTLSLYGFLFILITTDLRRHFSTTAWHRFHLLSYLFYLTALAHGMFGGTDTSQPAMFTLYAVTFICIFVLMCTQAYLSKNRR
ncbi:MAG: hypothetical protein ABF868_04610 [Sporolactobacillus sp.]